MAWFAENDSKHELLIYLCTTTTTFQYDMK